MTTSQSADVSRLKNSLIRASRLARTFSPENVSVEDKANNDPVTEADRALNELLFTTLVQPGDGWLSEETVDDGQRLDKDRVWIVDPIDGTREFLQGLPEWVVSVALVENNQAVAAGILNPQADELFLGSLNGGVTLNGKPAKVCDRESLVGARVLASRGEIRDGRWASLQQAPFEIVPSGSIAYKLALVAEGRADATISLAPKHEWDVAAGILLVQAAGGCVTDLAGRPIRFNQEDTLIPGIIAAGPRTAKELRTLLDALL